MIAYLRVHPSQGFPAMRRIFMQATFSAEGWICAQGEVVAVQMPEHLASK